MLRPIADNASHFCCNAAFLRRTPIGPALTNRIQRLPVPSQAIAQPVNTTATGGEAIRVSGRPWVGKAGEIRASCRSPGKYCMFIQFILKVNQTVPTALFAMGLDSPLPGNAGQAARGACRGQRPPRCWTGSRTVATSWRRATRRSASAPARAEAKKRIKAREQDNKGPWLTGSSSARTMRFAER